MKKSILLFSSLLILACASISKNSFSCTGSSEACGFFIQTTQKGFSIFIGGGNKQKELLISRLGYELCSRDQKMGFTVSNRSLTGEFGSINATIQCDGKIDNFVRSRVEKSPLTFVSNSSSVVFEGGRVFYLLNSNQHTKYLNSTR